MLGRGSSRRTADRRHRVVERLLASKEPSIRWKTRVNVLGEAPAGSELRALREEIRSSRRVRALLAPYRPIADRARIPRGVYRYWQGSHWVLAHLAELGYPPDDAGLSALRDLVLQFWLKPAYFQEYVPKTPTETYRHPGVPRLHGTYRRCASQQGNALLSLTRLGLAEERCAALAERLRHWQWPDGGWNCARNPDARSSSFMETRLPAEGLWWHAARTGDRESRAAALRASEVFLERRLFRRRRDGRIIRPDFVRLHYPLYWHYDVLGGLRTMALLGRLDDERCSDALDLLEQKELPSGGWPCEARYYRVSSVFVWNGEFVSWGGASQSKLNEWVTVDALAVLRQAGRFGA